MFHLFVCLALTSAPPAGTKQPSIVVNPDTVITAPAEGLDELREAADEAIRLEGGHFGIAVKDFTTGESFTRTEGGSFDIGSPEIILAACALAFDTQGIVPLDTLSSRNETLSDQVIMMREGDLEACMRVGERLEKERIGTWLTLSGFTSTEYGGVQLLWPGAPAIDPNYSTPGDVMGMLSLIEGRLDESEIRRLVRNPFTRTGLEDLQSGGVPIYGFSSRGEGGRCRAAVIALPGGHRVGLAVLADDLCCEEKADLAFRMLWEALR